MTSSETISYTYDCHIISYSIEKIIDNETSNISSLPSTAYGLRHEAEALAAFKEAHPNLSVVKNGLFVSRQLPFIAASPDAYVPNEAVIEIKCPKGILTRLQKYMVTI